MLNPLPPSPWFSGPASNASARFRLWCIPFAGGGTTVWRAWSDRFKGVAEVVALRSPGRESRLDEEPIADFRALAAALADQMAPHVRPTDVICGHSLGALLAFEVARLFRHRGLPAPQALVVAGSRAADLPRTESDMAELSDDDFLLEMEHRYGGMPAALRADRSFRELFLPVLRADMRAYESYQYRPESPLDAPILTLGGENDSSVTKDEILGWRRHTTNWFTASFVPAGHLFVQSHAEWATDTIQTFLLGLL